MKVDLSAEDLHIIIQAMENMTIKGKDAPLVAKVIGKVERAFSKEVAKQEGSE